MPGDPRPNRPKCESDQYSAALRWLSCDIAQNRYRTLELERIAVDTADLEKGMYIAMLDRPWLETPFVFQGFEINDEAEVEQLQRFCEYVYVDTKRGHLSADQIRSLNEARDEEPFRNTPQITQEMRDSGWLSRIRTGLARMGLKFLQPKRIKDESDVYQITATVRSEAQRAKAAYELTRTKYELIVGMARKHKAIQYDTVKKAVQPTVESILRNPDAMAWTVFSKKKSGKDYSRAVATSVWSVMFGRHLGFDRDALQNLAVGGLLLDIGIVGLPQDLVNTEGALTDQQFEQVRTHVNIGVEILEASKDFPKSVIEMVRCHHERADGSGYPNQLRSNKIPVNGRIAGICDSYDAMTSTNAYSSAKAAYETARKLHEMRGKEFQAEVVEQFFRTVGMFPTGSVVELSDGSVGVVLEQNRVNALRPKLMMLLDQQHKPMHPRRVLDMQKLPSKASSTGAMCIAKGHEHGAFGIDPLNCFK